jgi:hypothetical protein
MSNVRFYYDNLFDKLDTDDITTASAVATLPAWYMQTGLRTQVWRSTGLAGQWVKWDYGAEETCYYVALVNHNLTSAGEITVTVSENADYSFPVYEETFDAWEPVFGFGEGGFGDHGFGGYLPNSTLAELAPGAIRVLYFGQAVSGRYWKIELSDDANGDGYFEIGRIFNGLYWEPPRNFKLGWQFIPGDSSTVDYSAGGSPWTDVGSKQYSVSMDLKIQSSDVWWTLVDMLRRWGIRKDIIISLFPEGTPSELFFTTLYGRFTAIPPVAAETAVLSGVQLTFKESL